MALSTLAQDPRIHRITAIWNWDSIVELFFIDGPTRALIDTGASDTPRECIEPALRALDLTLSDIDVILNTHGHQDHMGGNHALLSQTEAQVYMHQEDAFLVEDLEAHMDYIWHADKHVLGQDLSARRGQFLHTVTGPSAVHRKLEHDEVVDLGEDIQLRVVHLPGHSPGSHCLLLGSQADRLRWRRRAGDLAASPVRIPCTTLPAATNVPCVG